MTEKKVFEEDKLDDEQLEQVAGGGLVDHAGDSNFFRRVGIVAGHRGTPTLTSTFEKYGVKYTGHMFAGNDYEIDGKNYPRASALCYVLKQMNYKNYNGDWQNAKEAEEYLKKQFGGGVIS